MGSITRITSADAQKKLAAGDADIYLDVRSTPEFAQGHPAGAWHIPLLEADPMRGMAPNPDFARVAKAVIPTGKRVVVGCQSGKRSQQAAGILSQEGYDVVFDCIGGFGGERDPFGGKASPGWAEQGLPVETGDGGDRSYRVLKAKA
ncbi:MAG: rhodanese-like domain-containing protein [Acidobacteriota bacterium]